MLPGTRAFRLLKGLCESIGEVLSLLPKFVNLSLLLTVIAFDQNL